MLNETPCFALGKQSSTLDFKTEKKKNQVCTLPCSYIFVFNLMQSEYEVEMMTEILLRQYLKELRCFPHSLYGI